MSTELPISIGILSWNSTKTIENTLISYQRNGLFELIDDVTVFFQEISENDIRISKKFNLPFIIGSSKNVGIGFAFFNLLKLAKYENILLLEHDWELIENKQITFKRLNEALMFLNNGFTSVRLRHRKNYGIPLYSMPTYKGKELQHQCEITGLTSPHLMDCIHWIDEPEKQFPMQIQKEDDYFISTSRYSCWTNNPCLFKKNFLNNIFVNFLDENDLLLEPSISKWWAHQTFKIAYGEGLFKHNDIEKFGSL
jgi:hypothetical protein